MSNNDLSRKKKKKEKKRIEADIIKKQNQSEIEKEASVKDSENAIFDEHLNARNTVPLDFSIDDLMPKKASDDEILESHPNVHNGEKHTVHFHLSKVFEHRGIRIATVCVLFALVIIISVLICVICSINKENKEYKRIFAAMDESLTTSKSEIADLNKQIEDLTEANRVMGETVTNNSKELDEYKENERMLKMPSSYPVKGTSSISDNTAEQPAVLFNVGSDASILATALGSVTSVEVDEVYGVSIMIDHGNGYVSVYKCAGVPIVSVGDVISKGSIIMKVPNDNTVFLYQIIQDGNYIDPMSCIEISG